MTSDVDAVLEADGDSGEWFVRNVVGKCLVDHEISQAVGSSMSGESLLQVDVHDGRRREGLAGAFCDELCKRKLENLFILVCEGFGMWWGMLCDLSRDFAFLLLAGT